MPSLPSHHGDVNININSNNTTTYNSNNDNSNANDSYMDMFNADDDEAFRQLIEQEPALQDNIKPNAPSANVQTTTNTIATTPESTTDGFITVQPSYSTDNPDEVIITNTSMCHWVIFEVPILQHKKPSNVAQYVLDVLSTASELDPTFALINTNLLRDFLIGTTRRQLLTASQFHNKYLRDDKA